jgi:hypothetical protein
MNRAFSASLSFDPSPWGVAPGCDESRLWRWKKIPEKFRMRRAMRLFGEGEFVLFDWFSAKGAAFIRSLGQRPRNSCNA